MPIPALIGAAGMLGSSFVNFMNQNKTNDRNIQLAQMNNQFNERMMREQMEYNTKMWNMNNEYNSPSKQVERLREAGLNPALALGQVASGQASSQANAANAAHAANNPTVQAPQLNLSGVFDALRFRLEQRQAEAQIRKTEEEARRFWIENQTLADERTQQLEILRNSAKEGHLKNAYQFKINQWQDQNLAADFQQKLLQNQSAEEQIKHLQYQNVMAELESSALPKLLHYEVAQRAANLLETQERTNLTKKQAQHEVEKMLESVARQQGFRLENDIKQRTADAIVASAWIDNVGNSIGGLVNTSNNVLNWFKAIKGLKSAPISKKIGQETITPKGRTFTKYYYD